MENINIILFDDHRVFSELLAEALNREENLNAVVINCFKELIDLVDEKTDILLLDMDLDGITGFDVISKLRELGITTKILILSAETDKYTIKSVLNQDISGFISKSMNVQTIINGIIAVHNSEKYLCSKTIELISKYFTTEFFIDITKLTKREKSILHLIGEGLSTDEIAEKLCISLHTVNTHRKNIRTKFNLTSYNELTQLAAKYLKYL